MHLFDLDLNQWQEWLKKNNQPAFRSKQIMQWIYNKNELDVSKMHNIGNATFELLQQFNNSNLSVISDYASDDGTTKWLMKLATGQHLETVYIPEKERGTLCISSQVGCALACSFCATGLMGLNRNLKTHEIISQVWLARKLIAPRKITNIVFMGMGEPLMNEPALYPALNILLSDYGFGLSKHRVTVSTSGIVPAMVRLQQNSPCSLALSLHAPNDELRNQLVPINKKYPISELIKVCKSHTSGPEKRHIMLEYLMLKDVNDLDIHAKQLINIASQFRCKINLIPYNSVPGIEYSASSDERVYQFQKRLKAAGIVTTVRKQRGDPIAAACGQLAGIKSDKTSKSLRDES